MYSLVPEFVKISSVVFTADAFPASCIIPLCVICKPPNERVNVPADVAVVLKTLLLPFELLSDKTPPTVNVWVVATSKFTQFKACGEGLDIWESIARFPSIATFPFPLKLSLVWYHLVELRVSENRKSPRTFSVEFVPV